jgi:cobalt-zinc-cadmium efflux system protein
MPDYPGSVSHLSVVRARNRRVLAVVLALTLAFTAVEIVGGVLTGSLALLADAVHMLSDNLALALALLAVWLAGRPSTPERSFGYQRAEILAALANGVILVVLAVWIFVEAWGRLSNPPEVLAGWMAVVAVVGLAVNLVAAAILARAGHDTLNMRAALRHVIADAIGSAGVLVAALVILVTGWRYADPLAGALIAVAVLASSWGVLRDSVNILLEAAPKGIDAGELGRSLAEMPGVVEVHDLHVWTITSGFPALSAHVLVERDDDCHARRRELEELLLKEYGIEHTTLQVDHASPASLVSIQSRW